MSDTADTPTPPARRGRKPVQGKPMTAAERKSRQRSQARAKVFGAHPGSLDLTTVSTYDLAAELATCIEKGFLSTSEDIMEELSARLEALRKKKAEERLKELADGPNC